MTHLDAKEFSYKVARDMERNEASEASR